MTEKYVYLPFPDELYKDLIRLSDGKLDVPAFAVEQVLDYLERNLEVATSEYFGSRAPDFYKKYFPDYAKESEGHVQNALKLGLMEFLAKPLVWKGISVKTGAKVRMQYNGTHHFAIVRNGKIVDQDGSFSPSQWVAKVANGTTRNAWRDIEFKEDGATHWVPAEVLRNKARVGSKEP